ncbi:macro domain-containing protein [Antarcticibacterium flavum]|uniref:Macro domain-containing protein n=1 Tax=Antarcticibacterium flavum TaxID=2058175 RepID=A0A5B7X330_9FLAO|nr:MULTISPECIES: macro domain-containing protein [Antarcticibacterium]MCM4159062.1 RNase III inhibitor [Antarcticibacterium sp. W02-3]QCY69465.1 macro domain-containing protein [Antarcticibacterium flavum]
MKIAYGKVEIEVIRGNIASQPDVDAVVNAANAQLAPGGGVAGALHAAAGPGLYEECNPLAPILPGEAVITSAHNLPNKKIIHCLGPVYGKDKPEDSLLSNCYANALRLANENELSSIAFPAISTGAFGYPFKEATNVAFKTILKELPALKHLQRIKFVMYSEGDYNHYLQKLKQLEEEN